MSVLATYVYDNDFADRKVHPEILSVDDLQPMKRNLAAKIWKLTTHSLIRTSGLQ